jgi:hypothetical protein
MHTLIQTKKNYFIANGKAAAGLIARYSCDGVPCHCRCGTTSNEADAKDDLPCADFLAVDTEHQRRPCCRRNLPAVSANLNREDQTHESKAP